MTDFEAFKSKLLEKLGYDVIPFEGDYVPKYVLIKDDTFHFMDSDANDSSRELDDVRGNVLIRKDTYGFHYCPSKNEQGEPIQYHMRQYHPEYFILWEDNEYQDLMYLYEYHLCDGDTFEYSTTDHYLAIKFHKEDNSMLREDNPFLDAIISQEKDVFHIGVHTFFIENRIIVADKDKYVTIYDEELNVLYESGGNFAIWPNDSKTYVIFPCHGVVYDLIGNKEIHLPQDEDCYWNSVLTYKDIFIVYKIQRYEVEDDSYYDDDGNYWSSDYNEEDIPIRNSIGHIFNSSFKLLRRFNVLGEVKRLKEIGDTIVMIANSSSVDNDNIDTEAYYNVKAPDSTRHIEKTDEDFSIPDISFRDMTAYEDHNLVIVKTRVPSADFIDFTEGSKSRYFVEKCGIYRCVNWRDGKYEKVIECKYDYIKPLPLENDYNVYYAGVIGRGNDNKFDLYVNNKIMLHGMPFKRGHAVKQINDATFIQVTNSEGKTGIIRNGKFIIEPIYKDIRAFVQQKSEYDPENNGTIVTTNYLFAVSNDELYGICSPLGKLILPMKYTTIDIDNEFCIVLVRDYDEELDDDTDERTEEMLEYGGIYENGYYDEEKGIINISKAVFKEGEVLLDKEGDYVWDGQFRYKKEDYNPWSRENYSYEDSLDDALGGEWEALVNIE